MNLDHLHVSYPADHKAEPLAPQAFNPTLTAYLDGAARAVRAISSTEVAQGWMTPSSLPQMTIGELATHLVRSLLLVEQFLDDPLDDAGDEPINLISAGRYFGAMAELTDPASELNAGIRERSREGAAAGARAVAEQASARLVRLRERLPGVAPSTKVRAFGGAVMSLEEYLRTRCVELAVHLDDLAACGVRTSPPASTLTLAVQTLLDAARDRHSELAVLRAMARAERAEPIVLQVF